MKTWTMLNMRLMTMATISISFLCPFLAGADAFDHSHQQFTHVLEQFVEEGLVGYSGLQTNPEGLDAYLGSLASVSLKSFQSWTKDRQLAFLINLYNAQTLRLILDHYPVKSIKDIGGLMTKPWDLRIVDLFDRAVSLNTIEHGMIRKNYNEPRIHFAVVCAARGCPEIRAEAYRADKLNEQLEEQAQIFLGDREKNRIDLNAGVLYLSPIFKWYKEDFQEGSRGVAYYISRYFQRDVARRLRMEKFKIRYTDYDWSLNNRQAIQTSNIRKLSNE